MSKIIRPIWIIPVIVLSTFLWGFESCGDWNTAILFGTALVITWYTYETYILRVEAQNSREFNQTPALLLRIIEGTLNSTMQIKNDSDIMAYDINFFPFMAGENTSIDFGKFVHVFYIDSGNQYIEPRSTQNLNIISLKKPDGMTRQEIGLGRIIHLITVSEKSIVILVHYKNSVGQKYYLVYKLYTLTTTQPALQFIATGKGEITYKKAQLLSKQKEPQLNPTYNILKFLGRDIPLE